MIELLYRLLNMWKKNISFFLVFVLLLVCEIPYITSIEGTDELTWNQCINWFFVFLWALPALVALGYIVVMRIYIPKAPKNTRGIAVYIVNANEKQYEAICKKFVAQFKKAVGVETPDYSVVIVDDYHSKKYYSLLSESTNDTDGQKQALVLRKRRCFVAILIDCVNGGEGEDLFCHMKTNLGVAHKALPFEISNYLTKDISTAFLPLREVDIMKLTETKDLSRYSASMDVICKYVLASTCFHCGDFLEAVKLLEIIKNSISLKNDIPEEIIPIKNVLIERIAVCYRVQAQYEYQMYCLDHDNNHLVAARDAISNKHCKMVYEYENKILEGICYFVLDRNVKLAIQCMEAYNKKDPIVKYNKIFLLLYSHCSINNIFRTYNLYKSFDVLPNYAQEEIEAFTFHEYKSDETKKQLLLILFFIYDYQNNTILAKRCLEQFCNEYSWVYESKLAPLFEGLQKKYEEVKYEESEEYCI